MNDQSQPEQPVMIHRALMGSLERFFGVLIEHYAGAFPMWLAPIQVKVITINEKVEAYANEINEQLLKNEIRSEPDFRNETLGYKIREATISKIPCVIVIGEKEMQNGKISVRQYGSKTTAETTVDEFVKSLKKV